MWAHLTCSKGHRFKIRSATGARRIECPRCGSVVLETTPTHDPVASRTARRSKRVVAVGLAASIAALAVVVTWRVQRGADADAVVQQPVADSAAVRPAAPVEEELAIVAQAPSAASASEVAATPVDAATAGDDAPVSVRQIATVEQDENHSTPLPAHLRRTLYQTALMQIERGDRSGALESAGKIAASLEKESRGQRLSNAVADVRSRGGGAANADFDSLMDLIREVIEPESWDDVGGPGSMEPFPLGVYVDAEGVLRRRITEGGEASERLGQLQRAVADSPRGTLRSMVYSPEKPLAEEFKGLRMISLVRLEQAARHFYEAGLPLPDEVRYLGGIRRVQYVLVEPERNDLIIAGPPLGAEDAPPDDLSALRHAADDLPGAPALQLDDLVVLLRSCRAGDGTTFGCTIEPRPEALQRVRQLQRSSTEPASTQRARQRWLDQLRGALGQQDVRIWGVPADSRVGSIMVTADYRMKLIGLALEEPAVPIPSYFELLEEHARGSLPPMETLRWWFRPHYEAIVSSPDGLAYELRGEGVQVLSENQHLLAGGQRVPTGHAEPINDLFARTFTQQYPALAQSDPLFAELRNVFDLAVVAALITKHRLAEEVDWPMEFFGTEGAYEVGRVDVPKSVESVVNYHELSPRRVVTAVSGGVQLDPWAAISGANEPLVQDSSLTNLNHRAAASAARDHWWWRPQRVESE